MLINQPINLLHIHFTFPVHKSDRYGQTPGMVGPSAWLSVKQNEKCVIIRAAILILAYVILGSITLGPQGGNAVRFTRRNKTKTEIQERRMKGKCQFDAIKKWTGQLCQCTHESHGENEKWNFPFHVIATSAKSIDHMRQCMPFSLSERLFPNAYNLIESASAIYGAYFITLLFLSPSVVCWSQTLISIEFSHNPTTCNNKSP